VGVSVGFDGGKGREGKEIVDVRSCSCVEQDMAVLEVVWVRAVLEVLF
jgi:hypothetical protein